MAVVTGGGKTRLAIEAITEWLQGSLSNRVLVLVPSLALLDQWSVELGAALDADTSARVSTLVLNSARTRAASMMNDGSRWLLVVDECHRAASEENRRAFGGGAAATLGLSATPERQYDDLFEAVLVPALGQIVFTYSYEDALRDGIVVPFRLCNYRLPLSVEEQSEYDRFTRAIAVVASKHPVDEIRLKRTLMKRARYVQQLEGRIPAAVALVLQDPRARCIVFHESTEAATRIHTLLSAAGVRSAVFHTGISSTARRANLMMFHMGALDVLVCCRALDEGLNVPRTSRAIIASSSGSERQRIQRIGRVLRPHDRKSSAEICTLFAGDAERGRLEAEYERLEGVVDIRWFRVGF